MQLYRSLGRIWTGTQADAKTAQGGKDYETIEVPDRKGPLIDWLNTFVVRPGEENEHTNITVPEVTEEQVVEHAAKPVSSVKELTYEPVQHQWSGNAHRKDSCEACGRSEKAAKLVARQYDRLIAEEAIWNIPDIGTLDALLAVIDERRKELTPKEPAAPPPARVRTRNPIQSQEG